MELTIYNTYVVMESQEQCDRMKQLCIDNNLPYWTYESAFKMYQIYFKEIFNYVEIDKEFYVHRMEFNENHYLNKQKVSEQEFINLIPKK